MAELCFWCGSDPVEKALKHEGPHLTWCPHFREEQRGGDQKIRDAYVPEQLTDPKEG